MARVKKAPLPLFDKPHLSDCCQVEIVERMHSMGVPRPVMPVNRFCGNPKCNRWINRVFKFECATSSPRLSQLQRTQWPVGRAGKAA